MPATGPSQNPISDETINKVVPANTLPTPGVSKRDARTGLSIDKGMTSNPQDQAVTTSLAGNQPGVAVTNGTDEKTNTVNQMTGTDKMTDKIAAQVHAVKVAALKNPKFAQEVIRRFPALKDNPQWVKAASGFGTALEEGIGSMFNHMPPIGQMGHVLENGLGNIEREAIPVAARESGPIAEQAATSFANRLGRGAANFGQGVQNKWQGIGPWGQRAVKGMGAGAGVYGANSYVNHKGQQMVDQFKQNEMPQMIDQAQNRFFSNMGTTPDEVKGLLSTAKGLGNNPFMKGFQSIGDFIQMLLHMLTQNFGGGAAPQK